MIVVQILPELNEGGVERGVVELTREFAKHGINSYVISGGGKLERELEKNGVKHIKINVYSKNIFTFFPRVLKLRKTLKEISPDIVHIRSRLPAWLLKFSKIGLNFKIVSTIHGLNSPNIYSKIMIDADKIICVSNAVKEHIINHFKADKSKISVVFRGVDLSNFNPNNLASKDELRAELGLKDELVISCVGRITHGKNIKTLIKAAHIFIKNGYKIKVIIAGGVHKNRQKHFDELKNMVNELNLNEYLIFLGSISDIAKIYKLSDVVVSPSSKPESFGRSIAEALAMNVPVVASDHGGVKDIIKEGENGYFFSPFDENELFNKVIKAKKLQFNGFKYISDRFNLGNMTEETMEVYRCLV